MSRLAVFIGRFQPLHAGHLHVITHAKAQADDVLVLVGSANRARSWRNPFTYEERKTFLQTLDPTIITEPLNDMLYDDASWEIQVRAIATRIAKERGHETIVLTGFDKDATSRYLAWFPQWSMMPVSPFKDEHGLLHATGYREALFDKTDTSRYGTHTLLKSWMEQNPETVAWLDAERQAVNAYKAGLKAAEAAMGYAVSISAVDAMLTSQGKVLLVQRNSAPGNGQWALPGGHVDAHETSRQAVLRELGEEANVALGPQSLGYSKIFDHPQRSDRGWIRTEAFHIPLPSPVAALADKYETRAVKWADIHSLDPTEMFEDHFDIIQTLSQQQQIAA